MSEEYKDWNFMKLVIMNVASGLLADREYSGEKIVELLREVADEWEDAWNEEIGKSQ